MWLRRTPYRLLCNFKEQILNILQENADYIFHLLSKKQYLENGPNLPTLVNKIFVYLSFFIAFTNVKIFMVMKFTISK